MKKLFLGFIAFIFIIAIIVSINNSKLPYDKVENGISDTQFANIGEMLRKGFTVNRDTAKRIKVNNVTTGYHDVAVTGYFVKVIVNAPGIRNKDIIFFMDRDENIASPIYVTDATGLTATELRRSKLYYHLQSLDEYRALMLYEE